MINKNKERVLRDICLNHSARSDKDIGRACPTKLNKQELEDVYYTLVDDNFRLKNQVLTLEQQMKVLTAKLQRMTNAQRSTIMKEKGSCPGSKALVHEQKELIEELQLANQKLVEKIKLLNMQMCSAKQFINSSGSGTRCSKCFIRNSTSMLLSSKRSENNLKASTSCQYIDKEVMTTRSFMTSVSVNTEQQEQKSQPNLSCKENKCAEQIEELKLKITELEQILTQSSEKHVDAISKLDHQGISLRQENITLRSLNSTLEEKLLELNNKLRTMEVQQNELSSELVLEKRKVSELVTELKINSTSSMNIAKTIEDHFIKMKIEESIKIHDEVRKQVDGACVKSDVASKYSEDSGYIDCSTSGHSDLMLRKQNQELVRRIDDLQNQIDALQKSKELTQHTQMPSPKRASEFSRNESVVNTLAEETLLEREKSSSPKNAMNKLVTHSSTDSDTKQDTIKNTDANNIRFSAFFVNIENASSPKDSRTAKDKPTDDAITNPIITNSNTTDVTNGINIPTKVNRSNKDTISVYTNQNTHCSSINKRDKRKDDSLKSDTEKRDRTRTLSKSSLDKTRYNKLKANSENGTNVRKREHSDSVDSAKTYVVPGNVDTRSPENTDCEISSYSDLPSERDNVCAVSVRSPGERGRLYSDSTTLYTSTSTHCGELSEGELPAFRTGRQLSLGEKEMSDHCELNDKMSSTQDVQATLTAVSAELTRCRQLLRLSTANL